MEYINYFICLIIGHRWKLYTNKVKRGCTRCQQLQRKKLKVISKYKWEESWENVNQ